jgi:hypothetical protein
LGGWSGKEEEEEKKNEKLNQLFSADINNRVVHTEQGFGDF